MKKRFFALLTAVCIALTTGLTTGLTALADGGENSDMTIGMSAQEHCSCTTLCTEGNINPDCPVCGAEGADLTACKGAPLMMRAAPLAVGEHDSHSNNWMEFTAGTTTLSGGSYYLSGDVEYSGTEITVSGEVILCLNGHKLDLNKQHISVGSGASLTLCDCSTGGVLTGGSDSARNGGGVYVAGGGTFTMTGGSIAGNTAAAGGGVYVDEGGTFTMAGGSINNNKATSGGGGGVMVNLGTFTLSGGSITGNATNDETYGSGGGVCLYGTFYLSGDSIIQNNTKAGATDNLYLGWNTIKITGPLGENARIGVNAEGVPRSFISGWSDNMASENPADYFSSDSDALGIGLNTAGDAVLGSQCTTITLNPNGGALPEYSLVAGAALPIPTKTGYTFAGWYENQEFSGDPVTDVPTDSTENLNFYAKWTANTYTVIFDANGGSVNPTSAVTVAGKLTSLPTPTYDGYDFIGWYTQKDGGDEVTTNTVFTKDTTIYAHWQKQEYIVTFDANGGSVTTISATTKDGKLESLPTPTYDGYTFLGWYTQKDSGNKVTTETVFTADSTIYAHWQKASVPTKPEVPSTGTTSGGSTGESTYPDVEDAQTSYEQATRDFWNRTINKIKKADEGDSLRIYIGIHEEIPGDVIQAIRENGVNVTFYNQDGDEVTVYAESAPTKYQAVWTLKQLGNYVLTEQQTPATQEESPADQQPADEPTTPTQPAETEAVDTAKPNPSTGEGSGAVIAMIAAAAALAGLGATLRKR